jgi:hypothetical protein
MSEPQARIYRSVVDYITWHIVIMPNGYSYYLDHKLRSEPRHSDKPPNSDTWELLKPAADKE